jgi:hypothetical protein
MKEREHLEDPVKVVKIILKWIFEIYFERVWLDYS